MLDKDALFLNETHPKGFNTKRPVMPIQGSLEDALTAHIQSVSDIVGNHPVPSLSARLEAPSRV